MSFIQRIYEQAAKDSEVREQARRDYWLREARYCNSKGWVHKAAVCRNIAG